MSFEELATDSLGICLSTLGVQVSYVPGGVVSNAYTLQAIFDRVHDEADPETGALITTTQPLAGVRRGDVPDFDLLADPTPSDELHYDGRKYRVEDTHEDGRGGLTLVLVDVGAVT